MIVRAIDNDGDWLFGKGLNDYKSGQNAVAQDIQTRLKCFLGDCFFDEGAGIDWLNFLGGKNETALNLAVSSTIFNTDGVVRLTQLFISLNNLRNLSISYTVDTSFGTFARTLVIDGEISSSV